MRELDGRRIISRVKGRAALVRRLRATLLAVHRFGHGRARTREEITWAARVIDGLTSLLDDKADHVADTGQALTMSRSHRFVFRLTVAEAAELSNVAAQLGLTVSAFVRQAIDEAIGDFQERRLFDRRHTSQDVAVERRRSQERRSYDPTLGMYVRGRTPDGD